MSNRWLHSATPGSLFSQAPQQRTSIVPDSFSSAPELSKSPFEEKISFPRNRPKERTFAARGTIGCAGFRSPRTTASDLIDRATRHPSGEDLRTTGAVPHLASSKSRCGVHPSDRVGQHYKARAARFPFGTWKDLASTSPHPAPFASDETPPFEGSTPGHYFVDVLLAPEGLPCGARCKCLSRRGSKAQISRLIFFSSLIVSTIS